MSEATLKQQKKLATKVTLVGALLDLALGVVKITVGLLSNSYALVTDGIHSLSDLITDAFVLIITRISREKPDAEHPYGHGRFETLGTIIIGIALFSVAGIICYDSIRRLSNVQELPAPGLLAVFIAAVSIVSKEWIYRYTKAIATQINSSLLLANAWHSRTDALSSIAVFIGVIGSIAGYPWMDTLAALFVAAMIAHIAWKLIGKSLNELVDTALPKNELDAIKSHIRQSEGIVGAHDLRSRLVGGQVFLDIHVQVQNDISVSEGHYLADKLSHSLVDNFTDVNDVVVHIDPELDAERELMILPLRQEVERCLAECWASSLPFKDIQKLNLHYLDERIQVEVFIDNLLINKELKECLNKSVEDIPWLSQVKIYGIF